MQFSFTKDGFTMFEIVVVIAIIGMIFAWMANFTFRPQENIVKAERLAAKIQSIIHSTNVWLMMGRMNGSSTAMTGAVIDIYISGSTNSGNSMYWTMSSTLSWKLIVPFFNDNDIMYQIESIKGCVGWSATASSWTTDHVMIIMDRDRISFTGSSPFPSESNILEIKVKYVDMEKKVIFDRRTGRTEIRRAGEDLCD